jgi:hypothetical protein
VEAKITESMAQAMADAHADGVSFRALGRFYGISPSLAHRHVHRVNGIAADAPVVVEPEPAPPGPESEEPAESEPGVGAAEPAAQPRRRPDKTEFPGYAGFLPEGVDATTAIPVVLSPESQRAEERRKRAERRALEDAQREEERQAALVSREQERVAADAMSFAFDLSSNDDPCGNAEQIHSRLADRTMPCDAPCPKEHVERLPRWNDSGMPG